MDVSAGAPMVSRTHAYRKVMKPLLERKRRARMNRSLDELKNLMVFALQTDMDSVNKLEKADILELTVKHLVMLKTKGALKETNNDFRSGYSACANEVSRFLATLPNVNLALGTGLMAHLGVAMTHASANDNNDNKECFGRSVSPASDVGYASSHGSASPEPKHNNNNSSTSSNDCVWRPF